MRIFSRILSFVLGVLVIVAGYFFFECFGVKVKYDELNWYKEENERLEGEIRVYTELKNSYNIVMDEYGRIGSESEGLRDEVDSLNKEIVDLEKKIADLDKKINNFS